MGITGLLPVLRPIQRDIHLRDLRGLRVGVDAYVWLHKGAFGCAFELATGKATSRYVDYCMRWVQMLIGHGICPVIVFDGGKLPMKEKTETGRGERRVQRRAEGFEYLRNGNKTKATERFQTSIDVTPEMAFEFVKALRDINCEYVVAPYEADAQLAYLDKTGDIAAIITEDSDLLTFGCSRVIYKLDKYGNGVEIRKSDLGNIKEMQFWNEERFRQACILAGCDYLDSPPGIGVKKALKLLERTDAYSLIKSWKQWGSAVKAPKIAPNYFESFFVADLTFQHQRVYDRYTGDLVPLTAFPDGFELTPEISDCIGPVLSPLIASGIGKGALNPITKEPFEVTPLVAVVSTMKKVTALSRLISSSSEVLKVKRSTFFPKSSLPSIRKSQSKVSQIVKRKPLDSIRPNDRIPKQVKISSFFSTPTLRRALNPHSNIHTSVHTSLPKTLLSNSPSEITEHRGLDYSTGVAAEELLQSTNQDSKSGAEVVEKTPRTGLFSFFLPKKSLTSIRPKKIFVVKM